MNRLLKVVDYLNTIAPASGWGNFQQRSGPVCDSPNTTYGACNLNWSDVVAMGHSQGAGVALYLGKFFPLAKVGMLSGSYDAYDLGGGNYSVAPWITEAGLAVANADIGTLLHTNDYGLNLFRAVENRRTLVRATNGGITCIVDPNGRITALLPPFREDFLVAAAPVYDGAATLYTRLGDWFAWLALAAGLALPAAAGLRAASRRSRGPRRVDKRHGLAREWLKR